MLNFKDYLAVIGIVLALFAVTILLVGTSAYFVTQYTCKDVAEQMELPYEWGPVKGCFVKDAGRWIPIDQIRTVR